MTINGYVGGPNGENDWIIKPHLHANLFQRRIDACWYAAQEIAMKR